MLYKELLRNLILGSPILLPISTTLISFFIFEFKNSITFKIFIFFIFVYDIILLLILKKIIKINNILFGYGLLLMLCGFNIHKINLIQKSNFPEKQLQNLFSLKNIFTSSLKNSYLLTSNNKFLSFPTNIPNMKLYKVNVSNAPIAYKMSTVEDRVNNFDNTNPSTFLIKKPYFVQNTKKVNLINPQQIKQTKTDENVDNKFHLNNQNLNANVNFKSNIDKKQINLLLIYKSILIDQQYNFKNLKKYSENLNGLYTIVKENLKNFDKEFDDFLKISKTIESEMIAFNASPKFFNSVLNNLHSEIEKFFTLKMEFKFSTDLLTNFIENILKLKNMGNYIVLKDSKHKTLKIIVKFKYFYIVISLVVIIFFILIILQLPNLDLLFQIFIVFCLIIFSIISLIVLAYVQILDRDCKQGKIEGCKKYLSMDIPEFNRSDSFQDSLNFENNLNQYISKFKEQVKILEKDFKVLITEKVGVKILVFKNLFDKINFVREEFKNITKNKVNEEIFYNHIKEMYDILDKLSSILTNDLKFTIYELYVKSSDNFLYLYLNKELVIKKIKAYAIDRQKKIDKSMSSKCSTLLDKLCISKEYLEDIFNMHIFLGICIFILLIL